MRLIFNMGSSGTIFAGGAKIYKVTCNIVSKMYVTQYYVLLIYTQIYTYITVPVISMMTIG